MTLIKKNPNPFPRFFDDFFTRDFFDWGTQHLSSTNTTVPAVNIMELNDAFTVEMAAPGMKKQNFHIELDNETLTVSSQLKEEPIFQEGEKFIRREFSYQSFKRSFHLPKAVVDENKIRAKYEDGMLRIIIPKKDEAKALPPRRIEIK